MTKELPNACAQGFCEDYLDCMQRLEAKQNECLVTERNVQMSSTNSCTRKKWDTKMALNGLHLRRAELARDCVQKNIKDATISESILSADQLKTCQLMHSKFPFAPGNKRKRRSSKRFKKNDAKRKASQCRKDTKLWHKQCSELAKCCPLTEECKLNTKEIMDQIYDERSKLRELNDNC
ncbi:unnamed protein product [Nippostrongylus brasiliensis]|uniref:Cytochrome c oxidase assembly factor 5 n=1 Tax=Nippostrongylus brasiliensis TaxID=27835 RepID=A0A0N4YJD6_NIPBR|nr:hypothetical protein Q1695_012596 [Nippostrongylus brasiliensis]VDL80684.1 unnamed protein product [Nippostrongylus brasiliensis]